MYLSCWKHTQSKFKYEEICVKIEESWKRKKNDNVNTMIQQKRKKKKTEHDNTREFGLKEINDDVLDMDLQTFTKLNISNVAHLAEIEDGGGHGCD